MLALSVVHATFSSSTLCMASSKAAICATNVFYRSVRFLYRLHLTFCFKIICYSNKDLSISLNAAQLERLNYHHLLLSDAYKFKNVDTTFKLKTSMSCDNSNLIYVLICSSCKEEYIEETGLNKTKLRDRVRENRQHIRQPQYQQLKVEGHLRTCSSGNFKLFPFLQMRTDSKFLRKSFEERFQKLFKTKLNRL